MSVKNSPIRVLHVVPYMQAGGTEAYIMNLYRNIDRKKIQFDFIVHKKTSSFYDEEIKKLGGNIYYFSIKDDLNFIKYIWNLNNFFKEHPEYQIIHVAMPSIGFICLSIAKHNKVRVRIAHSHSASYEKNLKGYLKNITCKLMKYFSNVNLACSEKAGKYLFGSHSFEIAHNAINLTKYTFNECIRQEIRNQLNIKERIVIGHVGRLSPEKNHNFMFEVLKKLIEVDSNYTLLLIGTGQLENELKEKVVKEGLTNNVIFMGARNDVNELLNCMDIFILPSLFEGLPTVAIEAQMNGLQCMISENVTTEVKQTENVTFIPLNVDKWVRTIINYKVPQKSIDRIKFECNDLLENYEVSREAKKIENMYLDYYKDIRFKQ